MLRCTESDLETITADVLSTMLGLSVERHVGPGPQGQVLTGVVQITGAWSGAVTINCTAGFARTAAAAMFGLQPQDLADEDVHDALGELANMTGGNVKNLVDGSCQLSLPTVTEGRQYRVTILGSVPRGEVTFACDGEPLQITVLERQQS